MRQQSVSDHVLEHLAIGADPAELSDLGKSRRVERQQAVSDHALDHLAIGADPGELRDCNQLVTAPQTTRLLGQTPES